MSFIHSLKVWRLGRLSCEQQHPESRHAGCDTHSLPNCKCVNAVIPRSKGALFEPRDHKPTHPHPGSVEKRVKRLKSPFPLNAGRLFNSLNCLISTAASFKMGWGGVVRTTLSSLCWADKFPTNADFYSHLSQLSHSSLGWTFNCKVATQRAQPGFRLCCRLDASQKSSMGQIRRAS